MYANKQADNQLTAQLISSLSSSTVPHAVSYHLLKSILSPAREQRGVLPYLSPPRLLHVGFLLKALVLERDSGGCGCGGGGCPLGSVGVSVGAAALVPFSSSSTELRSAPVRCSL